MRRNNVKIIERIGAAIVIFIFIIAGSAPAQEGRRISMDFQNAALKDVLKVFSQQAGLNFVATENIENKKITLYLDSVTVQDALDSIMKANNLAYDQAPGSAVFVVKESGRPEIEMVTKVYTLGFARVSPDKTGDAATGTEGTQQGQGDIKSILENLLTKGKDGKPLGSIVIDKRTNSVIITSIPQDFLLIEETLSRLDALTPQALIESEIIEIQTSALKKLGLEWGGTSSGTFVTFTGPTKITHFPFIRAHNPLSKDLLSGSANPTANLGTLSLTEFTIVIKALETEGLARYLAKPRIMALNNETAEIKITADTAVGTKTTSVKDTGEVIEEAERVETGITLKVTPTINKDNYITMTLEPGVSRAVQSAYFTNYVDPSKRSAKTTVMVKNGQTIAIGGLIKSDVEDSLRTLPGLSQIPLLGNFFRRDSKTKSDTELIIFITAHVIKDVGEVVPEEVKIEEPATERLDRKETADKREEEIKKTVIRLRKKREIAR